jgi:hypothetical protein
MYIHIHIYVYIYIHGADAHHQHRLYIYINLFVCVCVCVCACFCARARVRVCVCACGCVFTPLQEDGATRGNAALAQAQTHSGRIAGESRQEARRQRKPKGLLCRPSWRSQVLSIFLVRAIDGS